MSSPKSLWNGFFVMLVGIILSVLLMATVGQLGDRTISTIVDDGPMDMINADWQSSFEKVYTFQTFLFISCLFPALIGIVIFILSSVRRQKYDTYEGGNQMPQIDYSRGYK